MTYSTFNEAVKAAFLDSSAVKRGRCHCNEKHYEVCKFIDDLKRRVHLEDLDAIFKAKTGSYRDALGACIRATELARPPKHSQADVQDMVPSRAKAVRLSSSHDSLSEQALEPKQGPSDVSTISSNPEAPPSPSDWLALVNDISTATLCDASSRNIAIALLSEEVTRRLARDAVFQTNWSFASFSGQIKEIEGCLSSSATNDIPIDEMDFLASQIARVRSVLSFKTYRDQALLEILYLLEVASNQTLAKLMHQGCHTGALALMPSSVALNQFDEACAAQLPPINRTSSLRGVYLHHGFPRAIDGPNHQDPAIRLLYVGSGVAKAKRGTWKTGQAVRVIQYHLSQTARMDAPSAHYAAFYGQAAVDLKGEPTPTIKQTSSLLPGFVADPASTYCSLASFHWEVPDALIYLFEAVAAIALRSFSSPSKELASVLEEYKRPVHPWHGLNRQMPTADNISFRGGSAIQAEKGRNGALAAARSKNAKRLAEIVAGTYETTFFKGGQDSMPIFCYRGSSKVIPLRRKSWTTRSGPIYVPPEGLAGRLQFIPLSNAEYLFRFFHVDKLLWEISSTQVHTTICPLTSSGLAELHVLGRLLREDSPSDILLQEQ